MTSKQVIVVRNDLNMRKGKMIAQGAHASLAAFMEADPDDPALLDWLDGAGAKIAVSVPSEEALLDVYERARAAGLPCALITDAHRRRGRPRLVRRSRRDHGRTEAALIVTLTLDVTLSLSKGAAPTSEPVTAAQCAG